MCKLCDMKRSHDIREQVSAQALSDPKFAMMMALAVNYLMTTYDLNEVTIDLEEFSKGGMIGAIQTDASVPGELTLTRITDLSEEGAVQYLKDTEERTLN